MNRIAYTAFVAFWSVMATLLAVYLLSDEQARDSGDDPNVADNRLPEISREELARHDSRESCWKAIEGKVYDVTDYIDEHPTSPRVLTQWCGRESTEAWHTKGRGRPHSSRAEALLEEYRIGTLKTGGGQEQSE